MVIVHLSTLLGKKKWSVQHLANLTGIRYNTVLDLYHEVAVGIKFEHVNLICKAFDCSLSDLIEYVPSTKKNQDNSEK